MIRVVPDRNARHVMARLDRGDIRIDDTNRVGIDMSALAWAELVLLSVIWGGTFLSVAVARSRRSGRHRHLTPVHLYSGHGLVHLTDPAFELQLVRRGIPPEALKRGPSP